jgi:hypothetical protein
MKCVAVSSDVIFVSSLVTASQLILYGHLMTLSGDNMADKL